MSTANKRDLNDVAGLVSNLHSRQGKVRVDAIRGLAARPADAVLPALLEVLSDPRLDEWRARAAAAAALGHLGDQRAVRPLILALEDENNATCEVQTAAVMALHRLGNPLAIEPMAATLRDKDEERYESPTQQEALYALIDMQAESTLRSLVGDPKVDDYYQEQARRALPT